MAARSAAWLLVALAAVALAGSMPAAAQTTLNAWAQCGGSNGCGSNTPCSDADWTTVRCPSGYACVRQDSYYRQCKAVSSLPPNYVQQQAALQAAQQQAAQRDQAAAQAAGKTLASPWGQCGGLNGCGANTPCADANWATVECPSGFACTRLDAYFRQCKALSPAAVLGTLPVASPQPTPTPPPTPTPAPVPEAPPAPVPVASPVPTPSPVRPPPVVVPVVTPPTPAPKATPSPSPRASPVPSPAPVPSPLPSPKPVPSPTVPVVTPPVTAANTTKPTTNTTKPVTPVPAVEAGNATANGTANTTANGTRALKETVFTMNFPGVSVADFNSMYADKALSLVASISGVPASAVKGTYTATAAPAAAGRRLKQATAADGVTATYNVASADPTAVRARWNQALANNGQNFYSGLSQLGIPLQPSVAIDGQSQIPVNAGQAAAAPAAPAPAPASDGGSNKGKIIGGVVGGVGGAIVLGIIAALIVWLCRRKRAQKTPGKAVTFKEAEAPEAVASSSAKRTPGAPSAAPGAPLATETITPVSTSSGSSGVIKYGSGAAAAAAAGAAAAAATAKRNDDDVPDVAPKRDQNPTPYSTNPFAAGAENAAALPPPPRRSIGVRGMGEDIGLPPVPEAGGETGGEMLQFGPRSAMLANYNMNQHPSIDYTPTQPMRDSVDMDRNSMDMYGGQVGRSHPVVRHPASRASQDSYIEYVPTENHPAMRPSQDTMRTEEYAGATFPFPHALTASDGTKTSIETPPQIGAGMNESHPIAPSEGGTMETVESRAPGMDSHPVAFSDAGTMDSRAPGSSAAPASGAQMQSYPVAFSDAGTMRTSVDSRAPGFGGQQMQSYPIAPSEAGTMRTSVDSRFGAPAAAGGQMMSYPIAPSEAGTMRTSVDSLAPRAGGQMQSYPVALSDAGTTRTSVDSRFGAGSGSGPGSAAGAPLYGAAAALAATQQQQAAQPQQQQQHVAFAPAAAAPVAAHPIAPSEGTTRESNSMDIGNQVQAYQLANPRASMDSYIEYVPTESHPIQLRPSMDSVAGSYVGGGGGGAGGAAFGPQMGSHPVRFSTDSMMSGMTAMTGMTGGPSAAPAAPAAPAMGGSHPIRFSTDSMMSGVSGAYGSTVAPASIASEEALAAWRRQGRQ